MAAAGDTPSVKMMVSYGGEIIRRCPVSGKARYAGGENRLVRVGMSERLGDLRARLAALAGYPDVRVRYTVAADGGLGALRDVDCEADLWRLVTLLYCCSAGVAGAWAGRVRAFLFPVADDDISVVFAPAAQESCVSTPSMLRFRGKPKERTLMSVKQVRADSGFEAFTAAIAAEQIHSLKKTTYPSSSSAASSDGTLVARADSGFEASKAIATEQRSPNTMHPSSSSSEGSGAGSGFEKHQACRAAAPVILVPVALRLVAFYPVIPVYPCVVLPLPGS